MNRKLTAIGVMAAVALVLLALMVEGVSTQPPFLMIGNNSGTTKPVAVDSSGNIVSVGNVASGSTDSGSPIKIGCISESTTPTALSDGQRSDAVCDVYGALFVRPGHPNAISCRVAVSTATTIQAVGGSCAAPSSGSIYITDVEFGTSAASGTAADSFPTLKSGTGGTCGVGTTVVWQALIAANSTAISNFATPIKLTALHEICWIMSTAGSKTIQIRGFVAP